MEVEEPISEYGSLDLSKSYTYLQYYNWKIKERIELIRGKIFKMSPAPAVIHQRVVRELSILFRDNFVHDKCEYFFAPFDVRLPIPKKENPNTVVQPDLCVICDNEKIDDKGCNGVPDLIVEVLSKGNAKHDLETKFDLYQEVGLPEYWIVNPWDRTVLVYSLRDGKYVGSKPYVGENAMIESVLFPEFKVRVGDIFKRVE